MRVCVFGAASAHIDDKYKALTRQLGEKLAKERNEIIFGAGSTGLMGALAEGAKSEKGYIHGIVPSYFETEGFDLPYFKADKITLTDDIASRKTAMIEQSDVFVILPGGVGTLEEFFEVLSLKLFQRHNKTVIIYNMFGYYDKLSEFLESAKNDGFINVDSKELFVVAHNADEVLASIKSLPSDPNLHRKMN